ncbi:MAG: DUF2130 domain-containing protein [Candidatus Rokubacteria bacterium]|nr:DUF2130 domain-containing protein [Candidatus Rokubacteria bacterium]
MTTGRCPTCGQPLPKGVSLPELRKRIDAVQRQAISKALTLQTQQLRREIESELQEKMRAQARRDIQPAISRAKLEGRREREEELRRSQRELKEAQRRIALQDSRTKELEGTVKKLGRQINEASPQRIGSVSQDELRRLIETSCLGDQIMPVPAGRRGADIVQQVCENGDTCGKILWEVKDTTSWSETWIPKAKGDGQRVGADYICIVTTSFPKGSDGLARRNGVIIIAPIYAACLAPVLRDAIVELHHARLSGQQRASKAGMILEYVTSAESKASFGVIADSVDELRKIQANERNYHDEHWRKEEGLVGKIAAAGSAIRTRLATIARDTPVSLAVRA